MDGMQYEGGRGGGGEREREREREVGWGGEKTYLHPSDFIKPHLHRG